MEKPSESWLERTKGSARTAEPEPDPEPHTAGGGRPASDTDAGSDVPMGDTQPLDGDGFSQPLPSSQPLLPPVPVPDGGAGRDRADSGARWGDEMPPLRPPKKLHYDDDLSVDLSASNLLALSNPHLPPLPQPSRQSSFSGSQNLSLFPSQPSDLGRTPLPLCSPSLTAMGVLAATAGTSFPFPCDCSVPVPTPASASSSSAALGVGVGIAPGSGVGPGSGSTTSMGMSLNTNMGPGTSTSAITNTSTTDVLRLNGTDLAGRLMPQPARLSSLGAVVDAAPTPVLAAKERARAVESFLAAVPRTPMLELARLAQRNAEVKAELAQLCVEQAGALRPRNAARLRQLVARESALVAHFTEATAQIDTLEKDHLLLPAELSRVREVRLDVRYHFEQVQLYLTEAQNALAVVDSASSDSAVAGVTSADSVSPPGSVNDACVDALVTPRRGRRGNNSSNSSTTAATVEAETEAEAEAAKTALAMSERCMASLVIVEQPFPRVLTKGKLLDRPVTVAILTGSQQTVTPAEHFALVTDAPDAQKPQGGPCVAIASEIPDGRGVTRLKLRMANGSRMLPVTLKAAIEVACGRGAVVVLESQPSDPFIVITNENQYEGSNGVLLRTIAFGPHTEIPWTRLANELQRHFLLATKQLALFETDAAAAIVAPPPAPAPVTAGPLTAGKSTSTSATTHSRRSTGGNRSARNSDVNNNKHDRGSASSSSSSSSSSTSRQSDAGNMGANGNGNGSNNSTTGTPTRWLSVRELKYLQTRFFGGEPIVNIRQMDGFWAWFGKVLQRLRSTRQVSAMWREGLVWAFASRDDVEQALALQQPGTFVVRFSERHPGMFVVSYKISPRVEEYNRLIGAPQTSGTPSVKHYLVKVDEISIQKTLPDFLGENSELHYILAIYHNDFGTSTNPPTPLPLPMYQAIPKKEALSRFYSKHEQPALDGYEPRIGPTIVPPTS